MSLAQPLGVLLHLAYLLCVSLHLFQRPEFKPARPLLSLVLVEQKDACSSVAGRLGEVLLKLLQPDFAAREFLGEVLHGRHLPFHPLAEGAPPLWRCVMVLCLQASLHRL